MGTEESTAQVHPKMLTKALLERAVANGKTKFLQGTVKRVMLTGSKVCGVQVDDYELPADAVLIALGPWSNHARSWFPKANLPDIYGMRAHSVVVRMPQAPPQALFLPNEMGEVYPRPDGTVYVCGEGDDDALPDDPKDVEFLADKCKKLKDNLETMCPSTKGSEVLKEQACYLPCTSNGAPIIGAIPCYEGAYIATGHTCWGILNGPATGKAMAELIWKGKAECVDLALFQP